MNNIKDTLRAFGRGVVNASRFNLANDRKNVSKALSDSINFEVLNPEEGSYIVEFVMLTYGLFIDKGVSGVKNKINSPYSYRSKGGKQGLKGMPPPSAFDKWGVVKGIAPRDEKGRFLPRKSVNFAIARSVFENGIQPSFFFTKPFNKYFENLSKGIKDDFNTEVITIIKKLEKNG
tara:strand:- start:2032 stop:2559 length:528 start_codon:yes stop_codon:yes gene_type:complete